MTLPSGQATTMSNQAYSEYKRTRTNVLADISCSPLCCNVHQLRICAVLCCHSNKTCAPTANLPKSAQLEGTSTIPPSYIWVHAVVWACSRGVVWACGRGQTHRQKTTDGCDHCTIVAVICVCLSVCWCFA